MDRRQRDAIVVYLCPRCLWRGLHATDTCFCPTDIPGYPPTKKVLRYVREEEQ